MPLPGTTLGYSNLLHRLGWAVLFVLWLTLGLVVPLGGLMYLLTGVALFAVIQLGIRRRHVSELWARDTQTVAATGWGKSCVGVVLLLVTTFMVVKTSDAWLEDGWTVLLLALTLIVAYALLRRILVVLTVATVVVATTMALMTPQLATVGHGDNSLLGRLTSLEQMGTLDGFHDLSIATVDLGAAQPVRLASLGTTATTRMEIGSITKALTGLVIADAVHRGEISMSVPISTYLPQMRGSAAGQVTMQELVTHSAGYSEFGPATIRRAVWSAPLGRAFLTANVDQTLQEARGGDLAPRGSYAYSSLGTATAGQAVAAAAGMSYPDLMRTRIFEPLGMKDTAIQTTRPLVTGGQTASGLRTQPWLFSGYAAAGAAVSTAKDLALLATALLNGTAPGMKALTGTAPTDRDNTTIGYFWQVTHWQNGQNITWHNGQTSGYTAYIGLDQQHHQAVIVLSDVARNDVTDLGVRLLVRSS